MYSNLLPGCEQMDHRDVLAWSQPDHAAPHTSSEMMTWLDATAGTASAMGDLVVTGIYGSAEPSEISSSFLLNRIISSSFHVCSCPNPFPFPPALSASCSLSLGPIQKAPLFSFLLCCPRCCWMWLDRIYVSEPCVLQLQRRW